mgnify:FL=1
MNKVMIGLLCGLAVSAAFAEYGAPFARDGKISLTATNGMCRVVHTGKQDWALTLKGGNVAVKPGEVYRLACRSAAVPGAPAKQQAHVSVVLTGEKGKVLMWGFGAKDFFAGEACESVFTIPLGSTSIQARVGGLGPYTGDVSAAILEKVGCVPLAADLPEQWTLESDALALNVRAENLGLSVTDKRTGRTWASTAAAGDFPAYLVRAVRCPSAGELEIDVTDARTRGERTVRFALDPSAPAEFTASVSGTGALKRTFAYPDAFASQTGDFLVVPVSEGFLLPLGTNTLQIGDLSAYSAGMSMPFFGISKGAEGAGWMTILETPDDAKMTAYRAQGVLAGAAPGWAPTRGQFGYTRRARYVFLTSGGYVAMAKRYRAYAAANGLVETFREKAKARPHIDRLLGAANVWYFGGWKEPGAVDMAKELKAAGLDRFLWSSGGGAATVAALAAMPDVLVGRYDCYRDVYYPEQMEAIGMKADPNNEICRNTSAWPHDIIWKSADSNDWAKAWGVRGKDGKTHHCATQCTLKQPARERRNVARELQTVPFNTRFIDVTTSVGWEECENPAHPMTRSQSRAAACELLGLLGREFNLVVGSEQGMDAAVPVCDYFEGMLSPWNSRMPHGRPGANRTDIFREGLYPTNVTPAELSRVVDFNLGEKYRIPLFELVYHDCACSHWYWYDYSNRPISLWPKRDLFNVLYGTAPMYIFDHRLWTERKEEFIRSYKATCPVARKTGYSEMLDHHALTADRTVQRSTFADGTVVTVNFGNTPYALEDGSSLAPGAFCVK